MKKSMLSKLLHVIHTVEFTCQSRPSVDVREEDGRPSLASALRQVRAPGGAVKFPANCLAVALVASMKPGSRFRMDRNRMGRWHFFWTDSAGRSWEFYKKGASGKSYFQNSLYVGEIKRTL